MLALLLGQLAGLARSILVAGVFGASPELDAFLAANRVSETLFLLVAGGALTWARALGEFGATIMVAGNIPGQTSTLSLAIFQAVQLGEDSHAFRLLAVSVGMAFLAVWTSEFLLRRRKR